MIGVSKVGHSWVEPTGQGGGGGGGGGTGDQIRGEKGRGCQPSSESVGQNMVQCWSEHGAVLVRTWCSVGQNMVQCWSEHGAVLVPQTLVEGWSEHGAVLVPQTLVEGWGL